MATSRSLSWPAARNRFGECGPHQIQSVLRARGIEEAIEALYVSSLHRLFDWTLPWDPGIVLARYGIQSRVRFVAASAFAGEAAASLANGRLVLCVIHAIRGRGRLHWVGAWGYDERAGEFLCYDSQAESTEGPAGNARYSAERLTRALPWRGTCIVDILS